ncbi:MAG: AraC-like DNA-binding protein [Flavobacteriales bacterium]|jgi:AraC-like DNA-binding protein
METVIFNLNDIPLLLVISQCILLAILLLAIKKGKSRSNQILSIFLLTIGIEALDTLISWSISIKEVYLSDSRHIFFILKFAVFLQGPLIYWYTKSLIYSDFQLRFKDCRHLILLFIFPFYLALIYKDLGEENLSLGVWNYEIYFQNTYFRILVFAQKIAVLSYGIATIFQLIQYRERIENKYSNIENINLNWLKLLVGGFLLIWVWIFIAPLMHQFGLPSIPHIIGLSGNYFLYLLINALVLYSLLNTSVVHGIQSKANNIKAESPEGFEDEQIKRLTDSMTNERYFLEPELTLEQLAEKIGLQARLVSSIINRKFEQNFFEFVNYYRVEEAKSLLRNGDKSLSMLDIMAEAGFNSKSAFNRFFKKYADMTPTQYRNSAGD